MSQDCCMIPASQDGAKGAGGLDPRPDLMIVGAGSAAFSAAITAAEAGARILMAGEGVIGGTCVNVGCVPSKALIRAMQAVYDCRHASRFAGLSGEASISIWRALVEQKQELVASLRKAKYADLLRQYPNIGYLQARASFTGNGTELEAGAMVFRPKKVILATGASPVLPPIRGIEQVSPLDSTRALDLMELPRSLLVIGGGIIGCELGQMFARAGVQVTICCRTRLLPHAEPEVSQALAGYLRDEGVEICQGVGYQEIRRNGSGVALLCEMRDGHRRIEAEQVLAATGRRPNTGTLRLDRAGVALSPNGGIAVNGFMQTTHPDVYAAGDVTGQDMFVYMAAYGAKLAAMNALNGNTHVYDNQAMPAVVFTDPQAAAAGWTEAEARSKGYEVKTSFLNLKEVPRYIAGRDPRGLIKLVADAHTDRLLGASILAPEADDSIQTAAMAIRTGLTARDLAGAIFPYLTAVEGLKLAAQAFEKDVTKLSCCAG